MYNSVVIPYHIRVDGQALATRVCLSVARGFIPMRRIFVWTRHGFLLGSDLLAHESCRIITFSTVRNGAIMYKR